MSPPTPPRLLTGRSSHYDFYCIARGRDSEGETCPVAAAGVAEAGGPTQTAIMAKPTAGLTGPSLPVSDTEGSVCQIRCQIRTQFGGGS